MCLYYLLYLLVASMHRAFGNSQSDCNHTFLLLTVKSVIATVKFRLDCIYYYMIIIITTYNSRLTFERIISGAKYSGVPHRVHVLPLTRLAKPKSVT